MRSPVFVTGATGYIGSQLVLALATRGYPVSALVRDPASKKVPGHESIRVFQGDILDLDSVLEACRGCLYTFHTAAFTQLTCDQSDPYYTTNVKGTANVLEASLINGVKKFIFTSSVSVLGPCSGEIPLTESRPRVTAFANDYEISKFMAEELVKDYNRKGLPGVILNVARVYGPGPESFSNGINRLIAMARRNRFVWVPGRLQQMANYVYIADVIEAHLRAMDRGRPGESYIIGGENATYETLFRAIRRSNNNRNRFVQLNYNLIKTGLAIKALIVRILLGKPGITPKVLDHIFTDRRVSTEKAHSELGYHITPLQEGIERTFAFLNNQTLCHENLYLNNGCQPGLR
jgi:nucleoside-diphosphate-sugar epimerase